MDIQTTVTDNMTDVLARILGFIELRRKIIIQNIVDFNTNGFIPQDLDASGFAEQMMLAVFEHLRSRRLLFCDTKNIKFGIDGSFEAKPIIDKDAYILLKENTKLYLKKQLKKLSQNTVNYQIAVKLLKQKNPNSRWSQA